MVKNNNVGFWIIFSIYLLGLIADITTTMLVKARSILETNMLYNLFGLGFIPIIALNIFIAWLLWWAYTRKNSSPGVRFMLILSMLMIITVRIYAVQNAMYFIENPITIEQAIQIATPEAKMETTKQVASIAYPPIFFSLIGFFFWKLDHNIKRRNKNE